MDPALYRPASGDIPTSPGVYRFLDERGTVIYVGKAKNLRSRLNSYFADPASLHPRTHNMVTTASKVVWTVVSTEVESLQLEYSWIKEHNPRFNIKYKDDKSYPYLAVTLSDTYPRVQVMRGAKKKGTKYFGPYSHAWAIRETVDLLLRAFPVRTCSAGVFRRAEAQGRPCLLGYIDKCSAPCVGKIGAQAHRELAEQLCGFLEGDTGDVMRNLEAEMARAAENMEYEVAARRRDDLGALERVLEKNAIVLSDATDADFFALHCDELDASVYGFHVRGGRVRGQRGWVIDGFDARSTADLMQILLQQLYGDADKEGIPVEILVNVEPTDLDATRAWLSKRRDAHVDVRAPQRGDKKALMETVEQNARHALAVHKTKRGSDLTARSEAMNALQEALDLQAAPLRIECYDISTLHGTHTVGSMVVFEDGMPRKGDYRSFNVSEDNAHNDLGAMREVLTRRFQRYLKEQMEDPAAEDIGTEDDPALVGKRRQSFAYPPQLVLVDGGQPQVEVARQVMIDLGLPEIDVAGLAKRLEEVWLPGDEDPAILPRTSPALYLLQRLRDEAHRFAITHHRSRRSKAMTSSALDNVPGLGPKRIKALLQAFGSVKAIETAGEDKIAELPGIGPKMAATIMAALSTTDKPAPGINVTTGEVLD